LLRLVHRTSLAPVNGPVSSLAPTIEKRTARYRGRCAEQNMRPRAFFDDGLFFMSFSIALGVIALIIPARGATADAAHRQQDTEMNAAGTPRALPDLPAGLGAAPAVSACTGMRDTEQRPLPGAAGSPGSRACGN
jgi:hypothetical protein